MKEGLGVRARGREVFANGVYFISESEGPGMAMILASKMRILGLKTNTSGTFSREIGRIAWPDPNFQPISTRFPIPRRGPRFHEEAYEK